MEHITSDDLKCPVCGNPINWMKNVGDTTYDSEVNLLAECWSGDTTHDMPRHLFLIKFNDLPVLDFRVKEEESEKDKLKEEDYY